MNPVFWALVVLALVLIWFLLGSAFKGIGMMFMNLWNEAKQGISDEKMIKGEKENGNG